MFKAHTITHTIEVEIEGTPKEFWSFFEFVKLKDIFKAAGSMPAIEKTSPYKEWHTPGNKRTVYFTSGDRATEEILECKVPNYFKYKVYDFTFSARYFVKELVGEWHILNNDGNTRISWEYKIFPKSVIHRLFILNFFKNSWIPYMELSMRLIKEKYQQHRKQNSF